MTETNLGQGEELLQNPHPSLSSALFCCSQPPWGQRAGEGGGGRAEARPFWFVYQQHSPPGSRHSERHLTWLNISPPLAGTTQPAPGGQRNSASPSGCALGLLLTPGPWAPREPRPTGSKQMQFLAEPRQIVSFGQSQRTHGGGNTNC